MYLASVGLTSILVMAVFFLCVPVLSDGTTDLLFNNFFEALWAVAIFSIIFGFIAGIIGLICIKVSKGALKGVGRTVIGILLGLLLIAFVLSITIIGRQAHKGHVDNTIKNNK